MARASNEYPLNLIEGDFLGPAIIDPALAQSKIDDDVALGLAAADECIAIGRRFDWLWSVANSAHDEPGLATVADPCPA